MKNDGIYNRKNRLSLVECGLRLKECREEKHLTQSELAEKIGVVSQQISNYENGRRGFASTAVALGSVLGVSANYLLGHTDFKTASDEWKANREHVFNSDDILIHYLRLQGYDISFETKVDNHEALTNETPKDIFVLGGNDKVIVNGTKIDMIDFQYMLDDIKDQIDFIIGKASKYQERRINGIALDNAYQAELRESKARTKIEDLISKSECTKTPEGLLFEADDIF